MSNVAKRSNGMWRARWRDPNTGMMRARHFSRKRDAEDYLDGLTVAVKTGTYVDPVDSAVTIAAFGKRWLAAQKHLRPSTWARYEVLLRVRIEPTFGRRKLSDLRHGAVAEWVAAMVAEGLAPATIRQAHRVLSLILSHAIADGRLAANAAARVKLPKATKTEKTFLGHSEVAALADAVPAGADRALILTLAYAGLRFGEAAALTVGGVDPLHRTIRVAGSLTEVNSELIAGPTKTHQARTVPIPAFLAGELAEAMAGRPPAAPLFTAPQGGPIRLSNWRRRVFEPACRRAGIEGLTVHGLRHSFASMAIASGATILAVSKALGHSSPVLTLSVYGHLYESEAAAVADRLGAAAEAARDSEGTQARLATLLRTPGEA